MSWQSDLEHFIPVHLIKVTANNCQVLTVILFQYNLMFLETRKDVGQKQKAKKINE